MAATEIEWAEGYRRQADADLRAAETLQASVPSVLAMLLQMAYEKIGKSALLRSGMVTISHTQTTHQAATKMMQAISQSKRKCEALRLNRSQVREVLIPKVAQLEGLNPAVVRKRGGAGPWLEYPWEGPDQVVRWPARDLPGLEDFAPKHATSTILLLRTCRSLCNRLHDVFA